MDQVFSYGVCYGGRFRVLVFSDFNGAIKMDARPKKRDLDGVFFHLCSSPAWGAVESDKVSFHL